MSEAQKPTIECSQNGPYIVRNLETLHNSKGEPIPTRRTMALCRCGGSANKPFCDGTHSNIGFTSERLTDGARDKRRDYVGTHITIHHNRGICSHAGFCTDNLASVFRMKEKPWIDPDGAEADAIIATIKQCPSGALSYSIERAEYRDQERKPMIAVSRDGPLYISGSVELKDQPWGEGASQEHYTLCRCGASKNKPFCDGTHWHVKFVDEKS